MKADILEAMADEICSRPVGALASFVTFDGDRPRLDGMRKGTRWDIDREQREWERANHAELAKYECRHRWAQHEAKNPDRCAKALAKWTRENWARLLAYRTAYAKKHPDREREWARHKAEKVKADPVRLAKQHAKYRRYHAKIKADPVRYEAKLKADRERALKRPHKGTRRCGVCGVFGHNRKTCGRS